MQELIRNSMVEKLISFFKRLAAETINQTPEGICPNCWGEQEYDDVVRDMYVDKQIDVNNHRANHAFIQDFVVTHLNGIKLKKGNNSFECPTCRLQFS